MERDHLLPIRWAPEEGRKLDRDQIVVRPYVDGLVKTPDRKATRELETGIVSHSLAGAVLED